MHRLSWRHGDRLDRIFFVSIVLKGLDGLAEVIGGVLLLAIPASTLDSIIRAATQHELSQDPNDWFAHKLLDAGHALEGSGAGFAAVYLLLHGIIKVGLVVALMTEQHWAYPLAIVFLILFIVYQLYRIALAPTTWLVVLTIFDAFVVWLTWREWRRHTPARAPA